MPDRDTLTLRSPGAQASTSELYGVPLLDASPPCCRNRAVAGGWCKPHLPLDHVGQSPIPWRQISCSMFCFQQGEIIFIKLSEPAITFNNRFLSDKWVIPPSPPALERWRSCKSIKRSVLQACDVMLFKVIIKNKFQMEMFWMCCPSSLLVSRHGAGEVAAAGGLPGQHPLQELNIGAGCTRHLGTR